MVGLGTQSCAEKSLKQPRPLENVGYLAEEATRTLTKLSSGVCQVPVKGPGERGPALPPPAPPS